MLGWNRLPFTRACSAGVPGSAAARSVALADGTRIELAPGSRLVVGRHQDRIALEARNHFEVPHDPSRELVVRVGDFSVRDIGTRFGCSAPAAS
ncbi:MAG: FecR domain-containing protein [Proteobacteria bacterium]|nr:FecR domain-containing protein [Pseudomonadota bacterium]